MGKAVSSVVKVAAAPVTRGAKAASSIVKGDIKGAANNAIGSAVSLTNPTAGAEKLLGTNFTGAAGIASGDLSSENLKKYGATTGGALGAAFLGPAGAGIGYQLGSGNLMGAAQSGLSQYGGSLVPGEFQSFGKELSGYAGMFGPKPSSSGGAAFSNYTPSVATPRASGESNIMGLALLGLGAVVIFKLARKKRG